MTIARNDLERLQSGRRAGRGGPAGRTMPAAQSVPRPRFRWSTRIMLPAALIVSMLGVLAYAAREAFSAAVEVRVAPVIAKPLLSAVPATPGGEEHASQPPESREITNAPRSIPARRTVLAQAPGWIEPEPFAISVQTLISGVVDEVLVLEGEAIERGQIVARLIDDDAHIGLRRAEAELAERLAGVHRAEVEVVVVEHAVAEIRDEVDRKRDLVGSGVSEGQYARLLLRLRAMEAEVEAMKAAVRLAEAAVANARVKVDEAALELERTVIRSPVSGVVLSRSVEPGTRISTGGMGGGETHSPGILRVYDPARLQVRADVPLVDIAKIGVGTKAEITTEAMPDTILTGTVRRIVHEADIQRNTVQVKVVIDDPSPVLKPDMLTRVRFVSYASADEFAESGPRADDSPRTHRLFVDQRTLISFDEHDRNATVWLVASDPRGRGLTVTRREVTLGAGGDARYAEVVDGVSPGDRLVIEPPADLEEQMRVRIVGEHES